MPRSGLLRDSSWVSSGSSLNGDEAFLSQALLRGSLVEAVGYKRIGKMDSEWICERDE